MTDHKFFALNGKVIRQSTCALREPIAAELQAPRLLLPKNTGFRYKSVVLKEFQAIFSRYKARMLCRSNLSRVELLRGSRTIEPPPS